MKLDDAQLQNVNGGFRPSDVNYAGPGWYARTQGASWSMGPYPTQYEAEKAMLDCCRQNGWGALPIEAFYVR